jgi:tetratricopeptide (TPR) repeat protein
MFRKLLRTPVLMIFAFGCFAQALAPSPSVPPVAGSSVSSVEAAIPSDAAVAPSPSAPANSAPQWNNSLGEAKALYRKGDFAGAIARYQAILQEKPKLPDAIAGLIRVYLKQKNLELAAKTADQALQASESPRVRTAHAEVLFRQGRIDSAEKEWVDVINSGSPEARAYLGVARVRRAIAMYKSAETMINKAHELDPADPDIQEDWVASLPRAQRIKYLEESLAGENNWDADERTDTANYLEYLKERTKLNGRSCRLVSKVTATETPLVRLLSDPKHLRGYGLTVVLNDHKTNLLLDTGANGILVKRSVAEKAGISKVTATKIGGIGSRGRRNGYVGIVESIKIGDLEFHNCPIEVMESRSVADENGLIGADVFEDFLVDLDFPDEKLKLSELPKRPGEANTPLALTDEEEDSADAQQPESSEASKPADPNKVSAAPRVSRWQDRYIAPDMQSYTRVFRFGHDLLVPTTIGKVPRKLFILDTGSLTNTISPAAAREVTKVGLDSDTRVEGLNGMVDKVYSANKAVLQFGHLRQENQEVIGFDTTSISDNVGTEVSGFLGFAMLRLLDIKIDYRDALVDFTYDPKRWHF